MRNWWQSERKSLEVRVETVLELATQTEDEELRAELAKYLCILVSGLIEQRCGECAFGYTLKRASPEVARYVHEQLRRERKSSCTAIRDLFVKFDRSRAEEWFGDLADEERDAVDSIRNNRNQLAHGRFVGLSLGQLMRYMHSADKAISALFTKFPREKSAV